MLGIAVIHETRCIVILLKGGELEAVECERDEIFLLARVRGAGICAVFEDDRAAYAFIEKHRLSQPQVA